MHLDSISPVSSGTELAVGSRPRSPFIADVKGQAFVANVNDSAGEYVAQDPAVFGAVGTGPTVQAAEEAFTDRINLLA